MPSRCHPCGAPVTDATICAACGKQLAEALDRVAFLLDQLDLVLTRQTRMGDRSGARSATIPLPFDPAAGLARDRLGTVLARWSKAVGGAPGIAADGCASLISNRIEQLRQLHDADRAHLELMAAIEKADRIIDLRPELWYAGPCPACGEDAYAAPGAAYVTCRCGWMGDANQRRQWLLQAAGNHLAHSALIAQALSRLGQPVTGSMIRGYAFRGRIVAHGNDRLGRPVYRVGDVLNILTGG